MDKIKVSQVVVVEGKYDVIKLDSILDGLIIPVNGFSVFSDEDKKSLLKELGKKNGIILITDSDTAGFKIRNYVQNICNGSEIINVYIPTVKGTEARKTVPSKEGFLGVEGISKKLLLKCLEDAGVSANSISSENTGTLSYMDLFELGLSGTENSSQNRAKLCKELNLPNKLSKKAFLQVLNRLCTREKIEEILYKTDNIFLDYNKNSTENKDNGENIVEEKAKSKAEEKVRNNGIDEANDKGVALFWDFHGTLTLPDNQWMDIALKLCDENFPQAGVSHESIKEHLGGKCLPWWTFPDRDTRHLIENDGWWKSCNEEFKQMYIKSGLNSAQAGQIAPLIRPYVVSYENHRLHKGAVEVLAQLQARGYKNYLLSNNFPELPQVIEGLGLGKYFDGLVVSALVGYDKPRKEIFNYAKTIANYPKKCIMIGDNPVDDIQGAKACGFQTILVNDRHPDYDGQAADYICKTLTEVLQVLK